MFNINEVELALQTVKNFEVMISEFVGSIEDKDPINNYLYSKQIRFLLNTELSDDLFIVMNTIEELEELTGVKFNV